MPIAHAEFVCTLRRICQQSPGSDAPWLTIGLPGRICCQARKSWKLRYYKHESTTKTSTGFNEISANEIWQLTGSSDMQGKTGVHFSHKRLPT